MNKENAIEVKNIKKSFRVYKDRGSSLKDIFVTKGRNKYETREVLKDISFNVKKGEAVGLIGHNGCGKSTTLKLLTKIMYPDSGTIEMDGRVASLIELGAGFHPDMSGRENIYINAAIFGLTKKEIDERLPDIIAFSELEKFIDNPVRTYSSGMYMRLAFSVAINVDADILLIDEILAVGDIAFQAKCFNHLRDIKGQGTTIVIVSHSLSQIEKICDRSIWIHEGLIREDGLPREVDPLYLEYMSEKQAETENAKYDSAQKEYEEIKKNNPKRWGSGEVYITNVIVTDAEGTERNEFTNKEKIILHISYKAEKNIDEAVSGIAIYRDDQTHIYGTNTLIDYSSTISLAGEGEITLNIDCLPVTAGKYMFDLALHRPDDFSYDFWRDACEITIKNSINEVGIVSVSHEWVIH